MQSVHPEYDALIFQPGAAHPITLPFLPRALLDAPQLCLGLLSDPGDAAVALAKNDATQKHLQLGLSIPGGEQQPREYYFLRNPHGCLE